MQQTCLNSLTALLSLGTEKSILHIRSAAAKGSDPYILNMGPRDHSPYTLLDIMSNILLSSNVASMKANTRKQPFSQCINSKFLFPDEIHLRLELKKCWIVSSGTERQLLLWQW
ncbi:alpha-crystallin A chain [Striga asiatica]|uniref:Alpha-crystallin A chain n=1 Tax=Striga asiatica TaxID=4170 RepID=A0A5A7PV82_STRAF|nr:alpha-crystallin A chain [Striga asiatica]